MNDKKFNLRERRKSFGYAFQGIATFFRTQHNAWIHVVAALLAVLTGFYLEINRNGWLWIILAIALVFITEMLNTAIEFLCDHISPEIHPNIKKVKDIAAAAVLIASLTAIAIGVIIFLPEFITLNF